MYSRLHLLHLTDLHFSSKTSKTTKTPRVGILPVRRWEGESTHEVLRFESAVLKQKHGGVSGIKKTLFFAVRFFVWRFILNPTV